MQLGEFDLTSSKLFLNYFTSIDKKLNKKLKPAWIRTYNFMSLLNLPAAMKLYGPLVNLWEGKLMGEAIIKYCKSELENGLRGNWPVNVMLKHYRRRSLKRLTEEETKDDDGPSPEPDSGDEPLTQNRKGRRGFKLYTDECDAKKEFEQGKPLSVVYWKADDGLGWTYGMAYGRDGGTFRVLYPNIYSSVRKNDLVFWAWDISDKIVVLKQPVKKKDAMPVLLLPLLEEGRKGYYTVVSSEWNQNDCPDRMFCHQTVVSGQ